jgi:hypothetical protein
MQVPLVFNVDEFLLPHSATSLRLRDNRGGMLDYWKDGDPQTIFLTDLEGKVGTLCRLTRLEAEGEGVLLARVQGLARATLARRFVHERFRIEFGEVLADGEVSEDDRAEVDAFLEWLDPVLVQLATLPEETVAQALKVRAANPDRMAVFHQVAALFLKSSATRKEFLLLGDLAEQVGYLTQAIRRICLTGEFRGRAATLTPVEKH